MDQPIPPPSPDEQLVSLINAIKTGELAAVEHILRSCTPQIVNSLEPTTRQPPLYFASLVEGDELSAQLIKLLVRNGAQVTHKDSNEQTILFYICREGKQKCAEILMSHGLNLDTKDVYGQTPLFYAASENRLGIMNQYGTKQRVNQTDSLANQTLLYYAARRGNLEMCKLIVEKGADIMHVDKSGKGPAEYARKAKFTEVADYLSGEVRKIRDANKSEDLGNKKSRREDEIKGTRQMYRMVYYNDKGQAIELNQEEVVKLIEGRPELQQYLFNPETIPVESWVEMEADAWQRNAMKVVAQCMKSKGAMHFLEPVDPVKFNILDYFDIVKQPMDLGTVKRKLQHNCYPSLTEFVNDMQLVWQNSYKYNGVEHMVSQCARDVQRSFEEGMKTYKLDQLVASADSAIYE